MTDTPAFESEQATTSIKALRIAAATIIVAAPLAAGYRCRSPWLIAIFTPIFTLFYALGKWDAWRFTWRFGGIRAIAKATAATLPAQCILIALLYFTGLGIAKLIVPDRNVRPLDNGDWLYALMLLGAAGIVSIIIRREQTDKPEEAGTEHISELDKFEVDPMPLTPDSFYTGPLYWQGQHLQNALRAPQGGIVKEPRSASEAMIAEAEQRLGVRLPDMLRQLYKLRNGGHVGMLAVPRTTNPRPCFDDWRMAFANDYNDLLALKHLRTLADLYSDFTDDPDEIPANADKYIVLARRYADTTFLDYTTGSEPRLVIADFDNDPAVDLSFDSFDAFFAALRRERDEFKGASKRRELSPPLGGLSPADRPRHFWGEAEAHRFHQNIAAAGGTYQAQADEHAISDAETRLGLRLPQTLAALYRAKNGGAVCFSHIAATGADGEVESREIIPYLLPIEYVISLAELSQRLVFLAGETPWAELHRQAERLVVLDGKRSRALLLDYRGQPDDAPAVIVARDLDAPDLGIEDRFESFDALFEDLRFPLQAWYQTARPLANAPGAEMIRGAFL